MRGATRSGGSGCRDRWHSRSAEAQLAQEEAGDTAAMSTVPPAPGGSVDVGHKETFKVWRVRRVLLISGRMRCLPF